MADIFTSKDAVKLFNGKKILFLGDSNMRATYKDLLTLINRNELVDVVNLRKRGEPSFENDKRTQFSGLIRGRQYVEVRQYNKHGICVEYHFITKCYNESVIKILDRIKDRKAKAPDVIIMNSCLWDITRWGPNGVDEYRENMTKLMNRLKKSIPEQTLFIWLTTFPVSTTIRGGLIVKQIDFMQSLLRFEIMEANLFCRHLVATYGYDVLDVHYYLRTLMHWRMKDGIHFGPQAVRFVTNLLLTHIALSSGIKLPGKHDGELLRKTKNSFKEIGEQDEIKLPKIPDCLLPRSSPPPKSTKNEKTSQRQSKDNAVKWKRNEHRNNDYANRNDNHGGERLKENNPWDLHNVSAADICEMTATSVLNALTKSVTEPFWKDVVPSFHLNTDIGSFPNYNYNSSAVDSNARGSHYVDGNNWSRNDRERDIANGGKWMSERYSREKERTPQKYRNQNKQRSHGAGMERYENRDWGNNNMQIWDYNHTWQIPPTSHQSNNNNRNFHGASHRYAGDNYDGFGPMRRYDYHKKHTRSRPY